MLLIALAAPFAAQIASPMPAMEAPAARAQTPSAERCALHHLPIPSGKGAITAIMRCTDRQPAEARVSMREAPAAEAPSAAPGQSTGS